MIKSRHLIFMRYVPPAQFARRIYMRVKRKLVDRLAREKPCLAANNIPKRLFLPHLRSPYGKMERIPTGWRADFVGTSRDMPVKVEWDLRADDPSAQLWRMNLHYFEYLHDMDVGAAQRLIRDWIEHCRPRTPTASSAAWTPYALSLRLSAWLDYWSVKGPFGDDSFQLLFSGSLREQTDYLCANLETDVKGNHLVKNMRALAEMGAAYDAAASKTWKKISDKYLKQILEDQILTDGMHYERSASYHSQVFCDLLTIYNVREKDTLSSQLADILIKMAQVLSDLKHPDDLPCQFSDSGLTMCIAPAEALRAFGDIFPDIILAEEQLFSYPDAGFFGGHIGDDYLVFKMGLLGPDDLMAHAHGDWGSFELSHKGQRIFVDQGVFEYVAGEKRMQSRSAAFHNTAVIDQAEQADFFGAFRCGRRPHPEPADFTPHANGFDLKGHLFPSEHAQRASQTRSVFYNQGKLTILDNHSDSSGKVASSFLVHPDVLIEANDKTITLRSGSDIQLVLSASQNAQLDVLAAEWWPNMGVSLKTSRIVVTAIGDLSVSVSP